MVRCGAIDASGTCGIVCVQRDLRAVSFVCRVVARRGRCAPGFIGARVSRAHDVDHGTNRVACSSRFKPPNATQTCYLLHRRRRHGAASSAALWRAARRAIARIEPPAIAAAAAPLWCPLLLGSLAQQQQQRLERRHEQCGRRVAAVGPARGHQGACEQVCFAIVVEQQTAQRSPRAAEQTRGTRN